MFAPAFAWRRAHRYRRHGLDKASQRVLDVVLRQGVQGASVLQIGGGGELQVEILKRGAAHTVNLELSPWYESEAHRLLADVGARPRRPEAGGRSRPSTRRLAELDVSAATVVNSPRDHGRRPLRTDHD